jgi:hypothetical protein
MTVKEELLADLDRAYATASKALQAGEISVKEYTVIGMQIATAIDYTNGSRNVRERFGG